MESGDGRELFSLQAGGQIVNIGGGKCIGSRSENASEGDDIILTACDKAPTWEVLGNGQLKINAPEGLCLAQSGLAPGIVDVAARAAVTASSTANSLISVAIDVQ